MDKARSRGLVFAFAAILVVAIVWPASVPPKSEEGVHPGSTYFTSRDGTRALFLVFRRLGYSVEQRTLPMGDFGSSRLAFVLAPEAPIDPDEVDIDGVTAWVNAGGTLVYAASSADLSSSPIGKAFDFRFVPGMRVAPEERQVSLSSSYWPATRMAVLGNSSIARSPDDRTFERITVDEDTLLERPYGNGRVIVVAGAAILSNEVLGKADNALFFSLLAERYGGGVPIVFDEFIHGMGSVEKLLPVARGPTTAAIVLALLSMTLYAIGAGKRIGRPSPEPMPPRRSTIEQVTALARLYERTASRKLALARLGITTPRPVATDAELVRLAQRREPDTRKNQHGS
jgi:hypothetical protein